MGQTYQKLETVSLLLFPFFPVAVLIKKFGDESNIVKGCWDSLHIIEVFEKSTNRSAYYKMTSTITLWFKIVKQGKGNHFFFQQ